MERPLRPKISISSFDDEEVQKIIYQLEDITNAFPPDQIILVEITSFGGSAYGCLRLIEAFNSIPNPVATYCNSMAMSAGLIIFSSIASPKMRMASPLAEFMLHEIQSLPPGGDIKDIESDMRSLKHLNNLLMNRLAISMGLKDAKDIRDLIRKNTDGHDLHFDSKRAMELGIVDAIGYFDMKPDMRFVLTVDPDGRYHKEQESYKKFLKEQEKKEKKIKKHFSKG